MQKEKDIKELSINPFELFHKDWAILSAGNEVKTNGMTISWGNVGVMWHKNIATVVVRPQRYTLEFMDEQEYFSITFFSNDYRKELVYFGDYSGRDVDKFKETGLTLDYDKAPYVKEGKLTLICKKLHKQQLDPQGFIDRSLDEQHYDNDHHYIFTGEIIKVLKED